MELQERFRYIMKLNNLSASAFADEIGVQRSSISHILSGRNKPSLEFIQKVLNRFPKVDATWLINGVTSVESDKILPEKENSLMEENSSKSVEVSTSKQAAIAPSASQELTAKRISRILVFYDDQSFEEFNPS